MCRDFIQSVRWLWQLAAAGASCLLFSWHCVSFLAGKRLDCLQTCVSQTHLQSLNSISGSLFQSGWLSDTSSHLCELSQTPGETECLFPSPLGAFDAPEARGPFPTVASVFRSGFPNWKAFWKISIMDRRSELWIAINVSFKTGGNADLKYFNYIYLHVCVCACWHMCGGGSYCHRVLVEIREQLSGR